MFELFEFIDPKSFRSVWFWILLAVTWSVMSFRTLNVPYDMMVSALKGDQRAMKEVELLSGISSRRNRNFFRHGGGLGTMLVFFILGVAGTFGFFYKYELALGIFIFFAPVQLIWLMGIHLSFKIEEQGLSGPELCKALIRRRFWNQVIGITVTAVAMGFMVTNLAASVLLL